MSALRNAIQLLVERLGIQIERASPSDPDGLMRLRSPVWRLNLDLGELRWVNTLARTDLLVAELDHARDALFAAMREHIAKHDRSPTDRLEQIEAAARALLDEMCSPAFDNSSKLGQAWGALDRLVRAKPGAVSWATWTRARGRAGKAV